VGFEPESCANFPKNGKKTRLSANPRKVVSGAGSGRISPFLTGELGSRGGFLADFAGFSANSSGIRRAAPSRRPAGGLKDQQGWGTVRSGRVALGGRQPAGTSRATKGDPHEPAVRALGETRDQRQVGADDRIDPMNTMFLRVEAVQPFSCLNSADAWLVWPDADARASGGCHLLFAGSGGRDRCKYLAFGGREVDVVNDREMDLKRGMVAACSAFLQVDASHRLAAGVAGGERLVLS
jgi:hypothetical protein